MNRSAIIGEMGPLIVSNQIDAESCLEWRKIFEKSQSHYRTFQGQIDLNARCAEYVIFEKKYKKFFIEFEKKFIERYFEVQCKLSNENDLIVYRYPVGVGFNAHHDVVTEVELERSKLIGAPIIGGDITVIALLSNPDEYEGGELFFPSHGINVKPPMGSMIAFPAIENQIHGVTPILSGERYSAVCRSNIRKENFWSML